MSRASEAMIFVKSLVNRSDMGSSKVRGRTSAYAAIHHRSNPTAPWQAKSGDPYWMFTIRGQIAQNFNVGVRTHIQRFISDTRGVDSPERKAKKLMVASDKLEKRVDEEPIKAARYGVDMGRRIAPRRTGTLVRAIDWRRINR
jgi:hypothetical protein